MLKRIPPELLEYADVYCSGAFMGAMLCWLFNKSDAVFIIVLVFSSVLNLAFTLLKPRFKPRLSISEAVLKQVSEQLDALRYRGILPPESQAIRDDHIQRLKTAGEDELAVAFYQSLHRVARKDAEYAVSAL